ncbi:MAG: trans-aconitate 2-methyltransferase [Sandaracinaceae bacterium]
MDPRERFSQTVEDYRRYRPDYPDALIDHVIAEANVGRDGVIVDVGCGTGISSRQLAARGVRVIGVDPNRAMLDAARAEGGPAGLTYVETDGETLAGIERADAIVGGQSFHWLDLERALPRFEALLPREGRAIAFFNLRDEGDPMMAAYEALLRRFSPEYADVGAEPRAAALAAHPGLSDLRRASFAHAQRFDREGLKGRAWSSSYVKNVIQDRESFDAALDALFDAHARDGQVTFLYRSIALSFRPRPAG